MATTTTSCHSMYYSVLLSKIVASTPAKRRKPTKRGTSRARKTEGERAEEAANALLLQQSNARTEPTWQSLYLELPSLSYVAVSYGKVYQHHYPPKACRGKKKALLLYESETVALGPPCWLYTFYVAVTSTLTSSRVPFGNQHTITDLFIAAAAAVGCAAQGVITLPLLSPNCLR